MKRLKYPLLAVMLMVLAACGQLETPEPQPETTEVVFTPQSAKVPLAHWNFNQTHTGNVIPANIGNGTLTYEFTSGVARFTGTTMNLIEGGSAGEDFTVRGGAGLQNNGRSFTLTVPTEGYRAIELTYATRRSPLGFTEQEVCYSIDGTTWPQTQCKTVTPITNTTTSNLWRVEAVNFEYLPGVRDNGNFHIRVTLRGATDDQGNNRFDNINILGVPIEEDVAPPVEPPVPPVEPPPADLAPVVRTGFKARMDGFFRPVDMTMDTFNVVRAGSTVPLKFRVFYGDTEITDPSRIRLTTWSHGRCTATEQAEFPGDVVLGGPGAIRYSDGQFIANWATPRGADFCYVVRAEFWSPSGNYLKASTEALFRSR